MGIYDDERSGAYDNSYNRNFYRTTDRRESNSKKSVLNDINEPPKVDQKYSKENPFFDEMKVEKEVEEIIDRIDRKNRERNEKIKEEENKIVEEEIKEQSESIASFKLIHIIWIIILLIILFGVIVAIPKTRGSSRPNTPVSNPQTSSTQAIRYMVVNADALNVRTGPSVNNEALGYISRGGRVQIIDDSGHWYKIRVGDVEGYVNSAFLAPVR